MLTSAIRDAAEARFSDSSNVIYLDTEWLEYINDRYGEIWGASPWWPWKRTHANVTVLANTHSIALATGVWRVESVLDKTNDTRLVPMQQHTDLHYIDPSQDSTGPPISYRIYNHALEVWPTPTVDTVIECDTLVQVTDLAASDSPVFPAQYHRMLVDGALALAYVDDGNQAAAKFYEDRFVKKLEQMKTDLLDNQEEGFYVVQDDFWGGGRG